jgi:hypothetical protein
LALEGLNLQGLSIDLANLKKKEVIFENELR